MTFETITPNPDLSIHENPPAPWHRIAIACRWKDAHAFRGRFPLAALIGPLRTVRGIDPLVRNLLANPQIRVLLIGGSDLTPGEVTTQAIEALWFKGDRSHLGSDLPAGLVEALVREVRLVLPSYGKFDPDAVPVPDEDRPSGRHVFAPRAIEVTASAPAGTPGQRFAGQKLSEVWPRVLQEVLRFGVEVPSKYGRTKELLGIVSVIRDPRGTVEEIGGRTPYVMSRDELEEYTRRISSNYAPEADVYSYGSRMGAQFEPFRARLRKDPEDRGLFLTPWLVEDQAKPGGRPCLVGVQFRALAGRLHLVATFRSHDLFAAYPQNLAALCSWLVTVADEEGIGVGEVEVLSVSAHVYDRDWGEGAEVVKAWPKGIDWDGRSTWRVEVAQATWANETAIIRATALTRDGAEVVEVFEGLTAIELRKAIDRSGLVTSIGAALWLGEALATAERSITSTG